MDGSDDDFIKFRVERTVSKGRFNFVK